ncbi:MAG: Hpt domain-containing protein, partial [Eubacterium sp.]|nr:Hpt domain-containing protein [Eubacterium sp.]
MDTSQYMDLFIDETKEHLQSLNEHVLVLEKEPENEDTINEIFRAAHTLKGMAGTMGFARMQRLTHDLENVFSEIRNGNMKANAKLIDVLFRGLDALESYLDVISSEGNEGTEDNEDIIQDLNSLLEEQNGGEPAGTEKKQEKAKETASGTDAIDRSRIKYDKIPIGEFEKSAIVSAKEEGKNIYGITVYLQEACILKAARAFLVFKSVESKGELIKSVPSTEQIEDEEFDFDFSWILATTESKESIKKLIQNVSEIGEVYIDDFDVPDQLEMKQEEVRPEVVEKPAESAPDPQPAKKAEEPQTQAKKQKAKVGSRSVRV